MSATILNCCRTWWSAPRVGKWVSRGRPVVSTVRRRTYSSNAYDYDGKTRMDIFNTHEEDSIMITGYSQYGFRFNNNIVSLGPVAVFPRTVLSWNVDATDIINQDSLCLFTVLEPKLDILIIGIGDHAPSAKAARMILDFMRNHHINVEVLRTQQACATFNFLNAEKRMVAAAMIPPAHITYNSNDLLSGRRNRLKLLGFEE